MPDLNVYFLPAGQSAAVPEGTTLLDAMRATALAPQAPCGGAGSCGQCRVIVDREYAPALTPPNSMELDRLSSEELDAGIRLACQARVLKPLRVTVPESCAPNHLRLQVENSMDDAQAEMHSDKPYSFLHGVAPEDASLPGLPEGFRAVDLVGYAVSGPLCVGLHDAVPCWALPEGLIPLGLAVDLGSTKIAAYLFDLNDGRQLASCGKANPQARWGDDIMSRIAAVMQDPDNATRMTEEVRAAINALSVELCAQAAHNGLSCSPDQIVEAVIVANTVMQHLFLGLDVTGLGHAPFTLSDDRPYDGPAAEAGLFLHPRAMLFMPPPVAGFVGSDHLAMLLGASLSRAQKPTLAVDIGTNTEVSLLGCGPILTCSTASGPAFEGAHVSCGMRAGDGAIEGFSVEEGRLRCRVIGGSAPLGLCGSGVLDAMACLRRVEALKPQGSFSASHPLVRRGPAGPEAVLCAAEETRSGQDLVLRRKDIGAIQLAKGAIRTGIELLLEQAGLPAEAVERVIIAGAFGTYLSLDSALEIGLFPRLPQERFRQVGNAAGQGAVLMLLYRAARQEVLALPERMRHCELAAMPSFTEVYKQAMLLA